MTINYNPINTDFILYSESEYYVDGFHFIDDYCHKLL